MPFISISNAQRCPIREANWAATIYHGLPEKLLTFHPQAGKYLAFFGRICPEAGVKDAIEIALETEMPLKIAAKVDVNDDDYFNSVISPLLNHESIEYVGEINDKEKDHFLGNAAALLLPIVWPEPFSLVTIESLACGTPVITYRAGSVEELLKHGVHGFIADSKSDAVAGVRYLPSISRRACRKHFERHFTAERMARDYVRVYEDLTTLSSGHFDSTGTYERRHFN